MNQTDSIVFAQAQSSKIIYVGCRPTSFPAPPWLGTYTTSNLHKSSCQMLTNYIVGMFGSTNAWLQRKGNWCIHQTFWWLATRKIYVCKVPDLSGGQSKFTRMITKSPQAIFPPQWGQICRKRSAHTSLQDEPVGLTEFLHGVPFVHCSLWF